ncbi:hypothetical protein AGMMS49940_04920 [Spirochaetia bacterium]|nr:hypothetical protein AGMMS49940_04920 [Spirochaetia bacterium]
MKKNVFFVAMLGMVLAFGMMVVGCDGGGGGGNGGGGNIPSTISYTYSSGDGYEMIITKANPAKSIISMKSIYPMGDYEGSAWSRAVLTDGETAEYTLRGNGVVKSNGAVYMGGSIATFTPASGKPMFTGTLSDVALLIEGEVELNDGTSITITSWDNITTTVVEFADYFGAWNGSVTVFDDDYPFQLVIRDGTWELSIDFLDGYGLEFDSSGVWQIAEIGETTIRVNIFQTVPDYTEIGYAQTDGHGGMKIGMTGGAYPGTVELSR